MISLELAKKLKAAGLKWEPKQGDCYWDVDYKKVRHTGRPGKLLWVSWHIWLPSLSQLLAEIEARDYQWNLCKNTMRFKNGYYDIAIYQGGIPWAYHTPFAVDTPAEAAGQALLWILEQEGSQNGR